MCPKGKDHRSRKANAVPSRGVRRGIRTVAGCALQHTRHRVGAMCRQGRALRAGNKARCRTIAHVCVGET
eukprot:1547182-Pleurochrysis_carterae.AAC.1